MSKGQDTAPQPEVLIPGVDRNEVRHCIFLITKDIDPVDHIERLVYTRLLASKARSFSWRSPTELALEVAWDLATEWALENRAREIPFAEAVAMHIPPTAPQPSTETAKVPEKIWPLIADLPGRQRLAYILVRIHGKSVKEAARIAGVAPSTIKTQLASAEIHVFRRMQSYMASAQPIAKPKDDQGKEQ